MSPNTSGLRPDGFTLIELLVVIALVTIVASLGLFVSMDFYKSYAFRSELDTVVSILEKARAQSLGNINGTKHGVCYDGTSYVIFEGNDCAGGTNKELVAASSSALVTWPADIVFAQLSGDSSTATITLRDKNSPNQYVITINNEGRISY